MDRYLSNYSNLKTWDWWMKEFKGDNLKESMDRLKEKYMKKKSRKQLEANMRFLEYKLKTVHKVLVKQMKAKEEMPFLELI